MEILVDVRKDDGLALENRVAYNDHGKVYIWIHSWNNEEY